MAEYAPKVVFVGYTVPDEDMNSLLESDPYMPIQTHRFAWSVVRALTQGGANVDLLSTLPAANYPANPRLYVRGTTFECADGIGRTGPYLNLVGAKHAFRASWLLMRLLTLSRAFPRPDVIVVHGTASPLLAPALTVGRLTETPVVAVVTDPPAWRHPSTSRFGEAVRRLDDKATFRLTRSVDGVIALTEPLAQDFVPGRPFLVMEGIAPSDVFGVGELDFDLPTASFNILYAGGLKEEYGVGDLVRAMDLVAPGALLHLFGKGEVTGAGNPRVRWHGMVSGPVLSAAMSRADLLVNPRDPRQAFTNYSFPSKLLEYLLSGRPTLSTRLNGIPSEYNDYVNWIEGSGPEAIAVAIEEVRNSNRDLTSRAMAGRRFVLANKSPGQQGKRMLGFLAEVIQGVDLFRPMRRQDTSDRDGRSE